MPRFEDTTGREALLKASGLKTDRILDVGMGGCACMSFFLARLGFAVTGVDRSPHAVHVARQNARTKRLKGPFVARLANAHNLPFEDGAFYAVISFRSLHHIDAPRSVIREMFRVCRPGGMVLIADLNAVGRKIYKHEPDCDGLLRMIKRVAGRLSAYMTFENTRLDWFLACCKIIDPIQ
ncbi:MAG: class I SAM-dependent methyltransferase [Kiritimatiellae bacterium]|nr:class I SAM-dependent methyltransferase [Kiritimatiellia bacterium]